MWERTAPRVRTGQYPRAPVSGEQAPAPYPTRRLLLRGSACLSMLAALVVLLDFGAVPQQRLGEKAAAAVLARVEFRLDDPDWLRDRRKRAEDLVPAAYNSVAHWTEDLLKDFRRLCNLAEDAPSREQLLARIWTDTYDRALAGELWDYGHPGGQRHLKLTRDLAQNLAAFYGALAERGVLGNENYEEEVRDRDRSKEAEKVIQRPARDGNLQPVPLERVRKLSEAARDLDSYLQQQNLPEALHLSMSRHFSARLRPNLEKDAGATERERKRASESVATELRPVRRGEELLAKDRVVETQDLWKLQEEARAFKRSLGTFERATQLLGLTVIAGALLFLWLLGVHRTAPEVLRRPRALSMLAAFVLLVLAAAKGLLAYSLPVQLAPVALAATAASLAFGQPAALLTAASLAGLVSVAASGGLPLALALGAGASVAALPAPSLRRRWDLLRYGLLGGVVQGVCVAGMAQLGQSGLLDLFHVRAATVLGGPYPALSEAPWGVINGFGCGLLLLGSLPLIEALFGIVTNIHLYELCDQNQPALRRLMLEAPGTWAHTLQVAALCDPAAEAIGANPYLVRAGVYYHDLGKVLKPEYFVENQMEAETLHGRLAPSVSALIILSHVKDGIEEARKYRLPQQVLDFIPQHHGTSLITFFYHSAVKKAQDRGTGSGRQTEISESFYRYPGPRPRSREAAIVMLADTAEAATRTLSSPSPARLRAFLHELIFKKLADGQFDECELTSRDLRLIEDAFVRSLVGRFHHRVRYPGQEEPQVAAPPGEISAQPSSREAPKPPAGPASGAPQTQQPEAPTRADPAGAGEGARANAPPGN